MEWIKMDAGREITACQKDLCARPFAQIQMYDVTMEPMQEYGWETTVCPRDPSVLLHVIDLLQQNVQIQMFDVMRVTLMEDVGWEITACQKDPCVHMHATHQPHLNVWTQM